MNSLFLAIGRIMYLPSKSRFLFSIFTPIITLIIELVYLQEYLQNKQIILLLLPRLFPSPIVMLHLLSSQFHSLIEYSFDPNN